MAQIHDLRVVKLKHGVNPRLKSDTSIFLIFRVQFAWCSFKWRVLDEHRIPLVHRRMSRDH